MRLKTGLFLSVFLFLTACGGGSSGGGGNPDAGPVNPPEERENNRPDPDGNAPGEEEENRPVDPPVNPVPVNPRPVDPEPDPVDPASVRINLEFGQEALTELKIFRRNADATLTEISTDVLPRDGVSFSAHGAELEDNAVYLYQASPGFNLDPDGDGVADLTFTEAFDRFAVDGTPAEFRSNSQLRLVADGRTIKRLPEMMKISYVSELLYENIALSFNNPSVTNAQLVAQMNNAAGSILSDITGDQVANVADVLLFSESRNENALMPLYKANLNTITSALRAGNPAVLSMSPNLSVLSLNGNSRAVDIKLSSDNTIAYLALGASGVEVVDVTNVAEPRSLDIFDTDGLNAQALLLSADEETLYVADSESGRVRILDVSDSSDISEAASINNVPGASALAVSERNNRIYATSEIPSRFYILNTAERSVVSSLDIPGRASDVTEGSFGDAVYIAAGFEGIIEIDLDDPSAPEIDDRSGRSSRFFRNVSYDRNSRSIHSTSFNTDSGFQVTETGQRNLRHDDRLRMPFALGGRMEGFQCVSRIQTCYVAAGKHIAQIHDAIPSGIMKNTFVGVTVHELALSSDLDIAYLATESGLNIVALNGPDQNLISDSWHPFGNNLFSNNPLSNTPFGITEDPVSQRAYMAYGNLGLYTLNVRNPYSVSFENRITGGHFNSVLLSQGEGTRRLYSVSEEGDDQEATFRIYGLRSPEAPNPRSSVVLAGSFDGDQNALWLSRSGEYVFTQESNLLFSANVSRPRFGAVADSLDVEERFRPVSLVVNAEKEQAYIIKSTGYQIVDISNPEQMVAGSQHAGLWNRDNLITTTELSHDGNTLFVTTRNGIRVIDITDPENPSVLSTIGLNFTSDLVTSGDGKKLYVYARTEGVKIVDISDLSDPEITGVIDTLGGYISGLFLSEDDSRLYVSANRLGLQVHNIGALINRH